MVYLPVLELDGGTGLTGAQFAEDILLRKKQGAWVISQYLMQRKCR